MMKHVPVVMTIILLVGCSQPQVTTESQGGVKPTTSRFHSLGLKTGMNREDVEKQVSALLGQQQQYSPYGNNLRGGDVQYRDGDWVLKVKYKAGAPAPWAENPDGSMQHYPPMDETVLEYKIERIPNQELKATGKPAP